MVGDLRKYSIQDSLKTQPPLKIYPNEFEESVRWKVYFFYFHESFIKIQIPEAIQDSLLLKSLLSFKSLTGIWEDFVVPNELGDDVK